MSTLYGKRTKTADPIETKVEYSTFIGLRNTTNPERIKDGELIVADNVDIDNSGELKRRAGFENVLPGSFHSLFGVANGALVVSGTELKYISWDGYTQESVAIGIDPELRMSYFTILDRTFYMNGKNKGVWQNGKARTLGVASPLFQPNMIETTGNMYNGKYQVAVTYVRADGQESGALFPNTIELTSDNAGIYLSNIPASSDPSVNEKRIYITTANGDILYLAMTLNNNVLATTLSTNTINLQVPLRTQFMAPPPAGQIVSQYRGHLLVAVEDTLFYSLPYYYETFDLRKFYAFGERIRMVAPVDSGIFIGTDSKIVFLSGNELDKMQYIPKANYGVVEGTLAYVNNSSLDWSERKEGESAIWTSTFGITVGFPDGAIADVADSYTFASSQMGAAYLRINTTETQYVSVSE